jgi:KipI family sensor histidine kinase inhibitor
VSGLRIAAVGDRALAAYPDDADDAGASARVRALDRALRDGPFDGFVESVPSVRSLLVLFDPDVVSAARAGEALDGLPAAAEAPDAGTLHLVPTRYGGEDGPDLSEVASACGLSQDAFVARHSEREYRALMLGFRPGFAYLGWLPEELRTRRRATPRVRVPAGSVAVAALQTAIYPSGSAGGWNLIGRASIDLFDPSRDPPVRIGADDRVRFVPTRDAIAEPGARASSAPWAEPALEVLDGGLATTVQDGGRAGHRRFGVAPAGALDLPAAVAANAAAGNPPDRAVLECTVVGPALRFLRPVRFAVAGADLGAVLERQDLGDWPVPPAIAVLARPGNVLRFTGRVRGCRAYVAFAGGLDVPMLMGSRSTDLTAGFGGHEGRALRAGDALAVAAPGAERIGARVRDWIGGDETIAVRVVPGPQADHFAPATFERFLAVEWTVATTSDRAACRLAGPRLEHAGPDEISSEGMVPGSIQVPPDGQPIVMLADGPTTGGYPRIATVVTADLALLAQALPGSGRVRFRVS